MKTPLYSKCNLFTVAAFLVLTPLFSACNNGKAQTGEVQLKAEQVVSGINIGWGMAFLPNGDLLVTEKAGTLYVVRDGEIVNKITAGIPDDLAVNGQGGFMDIELHPDYENNGWIYFSYSSSSGEGEGSNTAIMRAKLDGNRLVENEVIYKATPNSRRGQHYGGRIVFDDEGYLFFSVGDRGNRDVNPQDITRDAGKIYRIQDDGSIPEDNPFIGEEDAKKAIYSYGHRNPQGMAKHPESGKIWIHEHGPQGGDEINIIEAGKNYGWPVLSYGINYNGTSFAEDTVREGMESPIHYWDPSIAPSGMAFVTTDKYEGLDEGDLLIGSLKFAYIAHLEMEGTEVKSEKRIAENIGRLRAIEPGPDGFIYFTAEGSGVYRLVPAEKRTEDNGK